MSESETILLRRFAATGDAEAFSEIVWRHAGLVYGACLRVLADKDRAADEGVEHLSRLKKLEHVWLNHCAGVTDAGLKHIEGLTSLRELRLDESRVTKAGVDRLKAAIPGISVTVPATMRPAGQRTSSSSRRRIAPGNSADRTQTRRR